MTFEELGVREDLLKAIAEMGYENPMPVQEKVIPHLLHEDNDVVALAQTGTGKTAAFGLPVLQRIDVELLAPQALIIAPTRELCLQISGDLADYSKYIDGMKVLPVYGGSSIESQIRAVRAGVQIIVATPGRLIDLIERKVVQLGTVHTVILDEADEMLNMGFVDDINNIRHFGARARHAQNADVFSHYAARNRKDSRPIHAQSRGICDWHTQRGCRECATHLLSCSRTR